MFLQAVTLFQRRPNGDFVDATEQSLSHISLPYTGFGVGLFDMTNNGLLDMFSANGGVRGMAGDLSSNPKGDPFPTASASCCCGIWGKGRSSKMLRRWQLSGRQRSTGSFRFGEGHRGESHTGSLAGGGMRVVEADCGRHGREAEGRRRAALLIQTTMNFDGRCDRQ